VPEQDSPLLTAGAVSNGQATVPEQDSPLLTAGAVSNGQAPPALSVTVAGRNEAPVTSTFCFFSSSSAFRA